MKKRMKREEGIETVWSYIFICCRLGFIYFGETTFFLVILRFIATFVKIEIKEERSIL